MKIKIKWIKIVYIIGASALFIGVIDPLEGSLVILSGSALVALTTYLLNDSYKKIFLISSLMILFGVIFMYYLSSLGGFGGKSTLSRWWALLIFPYPIGWLISIAALVVKSFKKNKNQFVSHAD